MHLIVSSTFDHLPHVAGVELLPSGAALLRLEGGQVVEVPKEQNARFTPERYAPSVLTLPVPGPVPAPAFVVSEALRLPVMRALGFDLSAFEGRPNLPQVVKVEPLGADAYRLTLDAGYTFTLGDGTPRASLSPLSADGHALLITDWQSSAAPVFLVPAALYDELGRAFDLASRPATLERVEVTPRAVLLLGGGKRVEVPRPIWPQVGCPIPYEAGQPVDVSVYTADPRLSSPYAQRPKATHWQVFPDTAQGRACLEALGLVAQVKGAQGLA